MDWRYNTIWFDQLQPDTVYRKDFSIDKTPISKDFQNAEYAIIWDMKDKHDPLDKLIPSTKLLYLELNRSNIKNFIGIEKCNNLKRLELHHCLKLENDEGIGSLSDEIEFLQINQSKKFRFQKELLKLRKLKVLRLNDCGPIDNLSFLNHFPKLIDFRFVNTNIIDGNLYPILEHPSLRTVGFNKKRHYNIKNEKIASELKEKTDTSFKTMTHKDQYNNFRYNYE